MKMHLPFKFYCFGFGETLRRIQYNTYPTNSHIVANFLSAAERCHIPSDFLIYVTQYKPAY